MIIAIFGRALFYLLFAAAWAMRTTHESYVGLTGLIGLEVVQIAPALVYFLVVGLAMGRLVGRRTGVSWAALTATIPMSIQALVEQQTFYGGAQSRAVMIMAIDYLLPIAFAIAGALVARRWQDTNGDNVAT